MSRIASAFARAKDQRRGALITYVCAGDPSLEATETIIPALAVAGADIIEIGIPFSDPLADGPTVQAASQRALERGTNLTGIFECLTRVRAAGCQVPLVLMGYYNPVVAMGVEAFCQRAAAAGVDGAIIPDLPLEEHAHLSHALAQHGLDLVLLAAPTTPADRLERIAQASRGFLYFVSVTGVTGARTSHSAELPAQLEQARKVSPVPVAVGFGISTPEQAREMSKHADAVVVGSALVERLKGGGPLESTATWVSALAHAIR